MNKAAIITCGSYFCVCGVCRHKISVYLASHQGVQLLSTMVMFSPVRNCQNNFQSGYTILHSNQ